MPEVDHGVLGQLQTIVHGQRLDSPTDIETLARVNLRVVILHHCMNRIIELLLDIFKEI